jgi:hypothetical protein
MFGWLKRLISPKRSVEVEYGSTLENPPKVVPAGPMTTTQPPALPLDEPASPEPEPPS